MNRYPLWKYLLIALVLAMGVLYTVPNFFGESPAVQISSAKATIKLGPDAVGRVQQALATAGVQADSVFFEDLGNNGTVRVRFASTDLQFKAKTVIEQALNKDLTDPSYLVAFNLLPNTPSWLQSLHALPMYLGLDLRGGVHFLMQVDTRAVTAKRIQSREFRVPASWWKFVFVIARHSMRQVRCSAVRCPS
jgi:preprotein translocase subunit SecD